MGMDYLMVIRNRLVTILLHEKHLMSVRLNKGLWIIAETIKHPYCKIPNLSFVGERHSFCKTPSDIVAQDDSTYNFGQRTGYYESFDESRIEMTDYETLRQCKLRLIFLSSQLAALENQILPDQIKLAEIKNEITAIEQYLKEVYNGKMKKIRTTPSQFDKINHSIKMAVWRAVNTMQDKNVGFAMILKKTITIGNYTIYIPMPHVEIEVVDLGEE